MWLLCGEWRREVLKPGVGAVMREICLRFFCSQGTAGDRVVAGVRPRQASDPPWLRVKGLPGQSTLTPGTWVLRDSGQAARCPAGCVVLGRGVGVSLFPSYTCSQTCAQLQLHSRPPRTLPFAQKEPPPWLSGPHRMPLMISPSLLSSGAGPQTLWPSLLRLSGSPQASELGT